jgi:hypothetical protein
MIGAASCAQSGLRKKKKEFYLILLCASTKKWASRTPPLWGESMESQARSLSGAARLSCPDLSKLYQMPHFD